MEVTQVWNKWPLATHHRTRTHLGICLEKSDHLPSFTSTHCISLHRRVTRQDWRKENVTQMSNSPYSKESSSIPTALV